MLAIAGMNQENRHLPVIGGTNLIPSEFRIGGLYGSQAVFGWTPAIFCLVCNGMTLRVLI